MEPTEQLTALGAHAHAISYRLLGSRDASVVVDAECVLWLVAHWDRAAGHPLAWCAALAVERSLARDLPDHADHADGRRWWRARLAETPTSVQVTMSLLDLCGYSLAEVAALTRRRPDEIAEMVVWFDRPPDYDPTEWGDPAPASWLSQAATLPGPPLRLALDAPNTETTTPAPAPKPSSPRDPSPDAPSPDLPSPATPSTAAQLVNPAAQPTRDTSTGRTTRRRRGPRMVRLSTLISVVAIGAMAWAITQPGSDRPTFDDRDVAAGTGSPAEVRTAIGDGDGCRAADALPTGTPTTEEFVSDGVARQLRVVVPDLPDDEPRPLVLDLGEPGQSVADRAAIAGLEGIADDSRVVIATLGSAGAMWNWGGDPTHADDASAIASAAAKVASRACIDPERIVLVGHGGGALMAGRAACALDVAVSAVVMIGGSYGRDDCVDGRHVYIETAADDPVYPPSGGYGDGVLAGQRPPGVTPQQIEDSVVAWRDSLGCTDEPNLLLDDALRPRRGWDPCAHGSLTVVSRRSGGHAWWPDAIDAVREALSRRVDVTDG